MEKSFNVGDVVLLKSGGPRMTVVEIESQQQNNNSEDEEHTSGQNGSSKLVCLWFDKEDNLHEDSFLLESLNRY